MVNHGKNHQYPWCNMSVEQRADFLRLARRMRVPARALHLALPVDLCVQRVTQRQNHEGTYNRHPQFGYKKQFNHGICNDNLTTVSAIKVRANQQANNQTNIQNQQTDRQYSMLNIKYVHFKNKTFKYILVHI